MTAGGGAGARNTLYARKLLRSGQPHAQQQWGDQETLVDSSSSSSSSSTQQQHATPAHAAVAAPPPPPSRPTRGSACLPTYRHTKNIIHTPQLRSGGCAPAPEHDYHNQPSRQQDCHSQPSRGGQVARGRLAGQLAQAGQADAPPPTATHEEHPHSPVAAGWVHTCSQASLSRKARRVRRAMKSSGGGWGGVWGEGATWLPRWVVGGAAAGQCRRSTPPPPELDERLTLPPCTT